MQLLIILHIIWICLCGISFVTSIFSDEGKISTVVEAVLWGTLCACSVAYGGTFAFVTGIVLASMLGINVLYQAACDPKPTMVIHVPMCILFIVGVCQYTY